MPVLIRHPQSPAPAVSSLQVEVCVMGAGDLLLSYQLAGDLGRLRLPSPLPPERCDGLWRHTCFELFVSAGGEAYREFNFSPSGHWQAWAFASYRQGGPLEPALAPHIAVEVAGDSLTFGVRLPAVNLPSGPRLRLGLTAVVEAADGRLTYWALRHAAERPDFHRTESFALELDLSGTVR